MEPNPSGRVFPWTVVTLMVAALAVLAGGLALIWRWSNQPTNGQLPNGQLIAIVLTVGLVVLLAATQIVTAIFMLRRDLRTSMRDELATMSDTLDQMSVLLNLIGEQQLLTERAKSVAFREKERDTLRRAIGEEIAKQDYEAALSLVNEIESSFGYRAEAERLRSDINAKRSDIVRRQINDAIAGIDRHMRSENWPAANRESDRLANLYPADDQVRKIPAEIESRKHQHKRQLTEGWHDSVQRKDWDGAIEILKRLDPYLTPSEGESMQEQARVVFKEKLNNLRTQFALAVKNEQWGEANRVGDEVVRNYPNTQMAREVREMMETLRARAGTNGAQPVAAG